MVYSKVPAVAQHPIFVTPLLGHSVWESLEARGIPIRTGCRGGGSCGLCRVRVLDGAVHSHTALEQRRLSERDLAEGVRLACQLRPPGGITVEPLLRMPRHEWRPLPTEDEIRSTLATSTLTCAETAPNHSFGLAVDLGTTQIRIALWNLTNHELVTTRHGLNPQARFGTDLLTRLAAATSGHAEELARLVTESISEALNDMLAVRALTGKVRRVAVVGNTAMLALLTGKGTDDLLHPDGWTRHIECQPTTTESWRQAWNLADDARIGVIQPLAGFVGSDLLAGLIATRLTEGRRASLFIDFGTNTEIALWDGQVLYVTSAAGGPAFEGSGIRDGMPAEAGAISQVDLGLDHTPILRVIGNGEPLGLCGSGLVDAVAVLRQARLLSRAGRFAAEVDPHGFALSRSPREILLTKRDIDLFQRAKAAVGAGISCLLEQAGLKTRTLQRLCIGGAFGRYLRLSSAREIGLLPAMPSEHIEILSESALVGCSRLLQEPDPDKIRAEILDTAYFINLAHHPRFEDHFIQHLSLDARLLELE
ncbi:Na(+)-translocating NADH-quinone reductase subunit F [Gammaproteobacteria bacterium]